MRWNDVKREGEGKWSTKEKRKERKKEREEIEK